MICVSLSFASFVVVVVVVLRCVGSDWCCVVLSCVVLSCVVLCDVVLFCCVLDCVGRCCMFVVVVLFGGCV